MKKSNSTKKALCLSIVSLCLCVAMLSGTTFAWFTDSVKSENNIIIAGNLDVEMYWADGDEDPAKANWIDASKGAMFNHGNWEPGYAQARHILIANEGSLALNYKLRIVANGIMTKLADVIDVYYYADAQKLDGVDADNYVGTLAEVLGTEHNLSKKVFGSLTADTTRDLTLVLKMRETADNDYQGMDLGCTFSVELIATQMAHESDSFGNEYDEQSPEADFPAALVKPLDDLIIPISATETLPLDVGYKFQPTMGRPLDTSGWGEPGSGHLEYDPEYSVENSAYRYWHVDFVVKADRDVPANSMALAGYYSFFCDNYNDGNWIAFSGDRVPAGMEIRLVDFMAGGALTVSWNDLCLYGNDGKGFMCGAVDLTGENAGTTITVELRMYETPAQGACGIEGCTHPHKSCETQSQPITVGTFTYTFPRSKGF